MNCDRDSKTLSTDMVQWIEKIKDRPSSLGSLSVNGTRNIENIPVWMQIKEGKVERFERDGRL